MRSWAREHWPELAWVAWSVGCLAVTISLVEYELIPFHIVWVSLMLMYGWRFWGLVPTLVTFGLLTLISGAALTYVVVRGVLGADELTEVPLMAAMFLALVWHAQRRQSALTAAREAAHRERELLRAVSHELKTPITLAREVADLIRADPSVPESQADLNDLREELDRLATMSTRLTQLAIAHEGGETLARERVDIDDLVAAAVRRWRPLRRAWSVDTDAGIVVGDCDRLDAALDVLIDNAVKATEPGGRISLAARGSRRGVIVEVVDDGVGLPPFAGPRVFDPFWSFPRSEGERRGTGLGLAIARAIVRAHGGELVLRGTSEGGTKAVIRLPRARLQAAPQDDAVQQESGTLAPAAR
jgi:signal transduction histidine kinase